MDAKHLRQEAANLRLKSDGHRKSANKYSQRAADHMRRGDGDGAGVEESTAMSEMQHAGELESHALESERKAAELEQQAGEIETQIKQVREEADRRVKELDDQRRKLLG